MEALPDIWLPLDALPWKDYRGTVWKQREAAPRGELLIDKLLDTLEEGAHKYYTPVGHGDLRQLLNLLDDTRNSRLAALCVKLYLILDYDDAERTQRFLSTAHIPSPYVHCIIGYHALDHGDHAKAVAALTAAGDENDFLSQCIERLAASPHLLVSLIRLTQPRVSNDEDIAALIVAFVREGSIVEAWQWARKWSPTPAPSPHREDAIRLILGTAFGDEVDSKPVASAVEALVNMPFEGPGEDEAVWAYCADPPSTMSAASRNLLASWATMRLSAEGRHHEALTLLRSPGLTPSAGEATTRRQLLINGLTSILSTPHSTLDHLLRPPTSAPSPQANTTDVDLTTTAWQHVPALPASPSSAAPPHSLLDARAHTEALRTRRPAPPAALPPSASPLRRPVVPARASPFRPSPSPSKTRLVSGAREGGGGSVRGGGSPAPVPSHGGIAPLGPRRPAPPPAPATPKPTPRTKRAEPPVETEPRPAQAPPRQAQQHEKETPPRSGARREFPGAFGGDEEEDAMDEDERSPPAQPQPQPPAPHAEPEPERRRRDEVDAEPEMEEVRPKKSTKSTGGGGTSNAKAGKTRAPLAPPSASETHEEQDTPAKSRGGRERATETPRRSKRISVQARSAASPEEERERASSKTKAGAAARKGKSKA